MRFLSFLMIFILFSISNYAQKKSNIVLEPVKKGLTDDQLLEEVQKVTFRYFWDFADPVSGLARERSNVTDYGSEVLASGGSGFGVMAIIVAVERKWITREEGAERLLKIVNYIRKADSFHGMFPHWWESPSGKVRPFGRKDDGGDIVESAVMFQGLLCVAEYFDQNNSVEKQLRAKINWTWREAEWNWYTKDGQNVLYWHWSPNCGWAMDFEIRGYNECLVTYVLAASSPTYPIDPQVYHKGWAMSNFFKNGKEFYGHKLPLGFDYGGPLFFSHYSFMGLDPRGLKDRYADYWVQNQNHSLINYDYCVDNPKKYKGYGANCWGLTAGDNMEGYSAHSPTNDLGYISPTASLSSFPYTPKESMAALRHFYEDLGDKIWTKYGFADSFSPQTGYVADSHLAIDQGPIIVMIENYRTGLLWKLFMKNKDVQNGLTKLGFEFKKSE
ncbi:MAG: glucoamylase family protein [Saprospiraceae bacterium]